ncbi:shikimate kinase [Actinomyces qiguomingii]|uniref:shikimate kinase n=1 Tax=Actinomyces qiguomingii TaxID=2057800 RepID=UPI000CA08C9E|nr:shikimate kinase [Actinomyces qiguomingii]
MKSSGVVLIGVPGAGCSSVGRALAQATGAMLVDVGQETARVLGTSADIALVAVGEERYRRAETATALAAIDRALGEGAVVALGSGCLGDSEIRSALKRAETDGARLVHLTAAARRLATRNGLDAPRSVALGNVHQAFIHMLRQREEACADVSAVVVDTTETTPAQAAAAILDRNDLDRVTGHAIK